MSKQTIIVVAYPDRGAGNDSEALGLPKVLYSLMHFGKLLQVRLSVWQIIVSLDRCLMGA